MISRCVFAEYITLFQLIIAKILENRDNSKQKKVTSRFQLFSNPQIEQTQNIVMTRTHSLKMILKNEEIPMERQRTRKISHNHRINKPKRIEFKVARM